MKKQRQVQAASICMVQVGWSGEKPGQSDSPESHLLLVKKTIEIDPSDRFKHPACQAREGQVIRGQVWWVREAEQAKAKRKKGDGVHTVGEEQPSKMEAAVEALAVQM